MRWRFWRRNVDELRDLDEAKQALEQVRQQWPEVKEAARALNHHREANNFAHKIRIAMGVED